MLHRTLTTARSFSSSAMRSATRKHKTRQQGEMPERRLRALVSLYHQSSSWVTPENLDAYIDNVFTPENLYLSQKSGMLGVYTEKNKEDLVQILKKRKGTHEYGCQDSNLIVNNYKTTHLSLNEQELASKNSCQIHSALWGNDVSTKPGVESVMDTLEDTSSQQDNSFHSNPKHSPPPKSSRS